MTGRISAREAWEALQAEPRAVLIDVRTPEEWAQIGLPDLSGLGRAPVTLTWSPAAAPAFAEALMQAVPDKATPVYFLCRSGARSQMTTDLAAYLGYEDVTNIVDGFEGPPDESGRRGTVCGWQAEGLPQRKG
ncbi:hypothetical protein KOE73_12495 [Acidomonas methanolica]|nr:hypothetical protein [Acidomonas methanolica]MCQ9156025.1 hypothetical protein [Acidomonas methanolica]